MDRLLEILHVIIWQSAQTQNTDWVAALVDLRHADVLDYAWDGSLHDVLKCVCYALKHVRVHETPDYAKQRVHPFD